MTEASAVLMNLTRCLKMQEACCMRLVVFSFLQIFQSYKRSLLLNNKHRPLQKCWQQGTITSTFLFLSRMLFLGFLCVSFQSLNAYD